MKIARRLLAAALLTTLVAACAPGATNTRVPGPSRVIAVDRQPLPPVQVKVPGFANPPSGPGLTGYLNQKIDWQECGDGEQCAKVLAPMDYADPGKQAITLSARRVKATASPRLGTLFLNPGGPGGTATWMPRAIANTGIDRYDLVGFDPRGTGGSTPIRCGTPAEGDAYRNLDSSPDDQAELDAYIAGSRRFAEACWRSNGTWLEHASTLNTVRDLDLMRRLLGDEKMNFLGYSYGTYIGALYAELYPDLVGRLVLDAAADITDDDEIVQAMGFDLALGNFADYCVRSKCGLGDSKEAVLRSVTDFLERLDARPVQVGDRQLTQSLAATGILSYLYGGEREQELLAQDLKSAMNGKGARLLMAADGQDGRREDGQYQTIFYAFPAIGCRDSYDYGLAEGLDRWKRDQIKAPIYGKYFGPSALCPVWPVQPTVQLHITAPGAAPILVIGGVGDSATPYQQAVTMASQLESGVLVTYEGIGHGTYGGKSRCVDTIVQAYLNTGKVPADGVRCK